jgi:tripartite-type tricarboxylate transporter receptor subunit TctC
VLKSPDTQQRFSQAGYEVVNDTPEQLGATLKSEGELIGNVIRKAGIKSDI